MVGGGGAAQEHGEPVRDILGAHATVGGTPVVLTLGSEGGEDHVHGAVEVPEDLLLGAPSRVGEFTRPVSNVAGAGDLRSDVVVEIARQMEQQVSDRIAIGKRPAPQLLVREGLDEAIHLPPHAVVMSGQALADERGKPFHHGSISRGASGRGKLVAHHGRSLCATRGSCWPWPSLPHLRRRYRSCPRAHRSRRERSAAGRSWPRWSPRAWPRAPWPRGCRRPDSRRRAVGASPPATSGSRPSPPTVTGPSTCCTHSTWACRDARPAPAPR